VNFIVAAHRFLPIMEVGGRAGFNYLLLAFASLGTAELIKEVAVMNARTADWLTACSWLR
jgi:hypothetical protein